MLPLIAARAPDGAIWKGREQQITLTYDPAAGTLHARAGKAAQTIALTPS